MFQLVNRRDFVAALIKGGAALTLPYQLFAQQQVTATKLSDNFTQITGAGGNILVLTGPDGLLMVDGAAPERSAELMKFLGEEFKNQRIQVLFNTDWHPDHTGSNEAIRKAGAKIIAHENTKLWLGGDFYCEWQNRNYKPRPADALPTETFYTSGKMSFGSQQIEYGYLGQAHTDGDVYVYFPGANILVAGDAMWLAGIGETDLGAGALGVEADGAMAVGDMGEGALAAEAESAGAADGGSTYVLGHGPDRMVYEGLDGYKVLNVPNWTPALNDAWVDSGIHENASFLLTSPVGPETLVGQAEFDCETIYLREIAQLFDAGYTPFVDAAGNVWMLPPGA